ncbi:thioredoxin family protein [Roseomonas elaeocarpi]|uniref:Thioredoxin family protein n=1 Tax=Roseomonas elaeocarpi TaxID=907779 RepID=A0ABV6JR01_9PROT
MASVIDIGSVRGLPMRRVESTELDTVLAEEVRERLSILLLWETNCVACDTIRRALGEAPERFRWPGVRWLQGDVRADPWIATRFGLHGIPAFLLFSGHRVLGRITGWPGGESFGRIVAHQLQRTAQSPLPPRIHRPRGGDLLPRA